MNTLLYLWITSFTFYIIILSRDLLEKKFLTNKEHEEPNEAVRQDIFNIVKTIGLLLIFLPITIYVFTSFNGIDVNLPIPKWAWLFLSFFGLNYLYKKGVL